MTETTNRVDRVPALAISGVSYAYGKKPALSDVSFTVDRGRVTILLGPNGAGKSTLFALVTRLFAAERGDIVIGGRSIAASGAAALAALGIVFQQPTLDLDLTVRQNLAYFGALRGLSVADAKRRGTEELSRLKMAERADEKVRSLNGGHRRRVEIARAFLHEPEILLLDEPTVGLDIPTRKMLIEHLHERARRDHVAILWATHLIDEIMPNDRIVVLDNGQVVADGDVGHILAAAEADDLDTAFTTLTRSRPEGQAA